jgi:hypothetical protein
VNPRRGTAAAAAADCGDRPEGTAAVPFGGVLDVDAGRWLPLTESPAATPAPTDGAARPSARLGPGGGDVAVRDGWAYDARRETWVEVPPIPGRDRPFVSWTEAWAGDRILVFANGVHEGQGTDSRAARVRDGWSWRPR